jgi:hypothetical protein
VMDARRSSIWAVREPICSIKRKVSGIKDLNLWLGVQVEGS